MSENLATLHKKKFIEKVGRRKESIARVRISPASKFSLVINGKTLEEYFPIKEQQEKILSVFQKSEIKDKYLTTALVKGGGNTGQAEAIVLGIARILAEISPEAKSLVKKAGFLTRDSRVVERKKFGLKKARKRPQWSKR